MVMSIKKTTRIVGVLFITELVVHVIGSTLIEGILAEPDYLTQLSINRNIVMTGVLLEVVCAVSLLAIGILLYPILKKHTQMVAVGYFGFRIVETVIATGFSISHLMMFALSQAYVVAGNSAAPYYQTLGALLMARHNFNYQIYVIFYSLGCLILFLSLFKTRLVPRYISVLGFVTAIIMLVGLVLELFGFAIGMEIYATPLGLCQVILAIWLIVKGLKPLENASRTGQSKI